MDLFDSPTEPHTVECKRCGTRKDINIKGGGYNRTVKSYCGNCMDLTEWKMVIL